MRLWSLHPKYLDARGLVAAWREALLAQAVIRGNTTGYTAHPQLIRFRRARVPVTCIGRYLTAIHEEGRRRGYRFDRRKIARPGRSARIVTTTGQLKYEWRHLRAKLSVRDPEWLRNLPPRILPEAHPLFDVVEGPAEEWEKGVPRGRRHGTDR